MFTRIKDNRIQLATKRRCHYLENSLAVLSSDCPTKDSTTAELNFNAAEGATHLYYSSRKQAMKTVKTLPSVSLQPTKPHFVDRSIDLATLMLHIQSSFRRALNIYFRYRFNLSFLSELMDDVTLARMVLPRRSSDQNSLAEQKNTPISQMVHSDKEATATIFSMDLVLKFTDSSLLN